jgi:hypothetical protein
VIAHGLLIHGQVEIVVGKDDSVVFICFVVLHFLSFLSFFHFLGWVAYPSCFIIWVVHCHAPPNPFFDKLQILLGLFVFDSV